MNKANKLGFIESLEKDKLIALHF